MVINLGFEANNFTCLYAMPGLGCNIPEMLVLGIFFILGSFACIYFTFHQYKNKKSDKQHSPYGYSIIFFASMSFWMAFRGVISIFPFKYTHLTYNIVFTNISTILFTIPLSFVILILCNILFTYRNPETKMIIFFKMLFFIFFIAFLFIAFVIAIANANDTEEHDRAIKLWRCCTDLIICFFFTGPAIQLIKEIAIKFPNKKFLTISIAGVAIFCFIFILRVIYNSLSYLNLNPIENLIKDDINDSENPKKFPSTTTRAFTFVYYLIFDFFASCLGIAAVIYIDKKELDILSGPKYEQQKSDSLIE